MLPRIPLAKRTRAKPAAAAGSLPEATPAKPSATQGEVEEFIPDTQADEEDPIEDSEEENLQTTTRIKPRVSFIKPLIEVVIGDQAKKQFLK